MAAKPPLNVRTPPWALPLAFGAFFIGLATVVFGPMVLFAIGNARVGAVMAEEGRFDVPFQQETSEAVYEQVADDYKWAFAAGCGAGFGGMIGLMLIWVSRPLGSDEDEESPVDAAADSSG